MTMINKDILLGKLNKIEDYLDLIRKEIICDLKPNKLIINDIVELLEYIKKES